MHHANTPFRSHRVDLTFMSFQFGANGTAPPTKLGAAHYPCHAGLALRFSHELRSHAGHRPDGSHDCINHHRSRHDNHRIDIPPKNHAVRLKNQRFKKTKRNGPERERMAGLFRLEAGAKAGGVDTTALPRAVASSALAVFFRGACWLAA
jgi:hypothetical protein